jgi:hypothetical protein
MAGKGIWPPPLPPPTATQGSNDPHPLLLAAIEALLLALLPASVLPRAPSAGVGASSAAQVCRRRPWGELRRGGVVAVAW